jgi:hypothetical protein
MPLTIRVETETGGVIQEMADLGNVFSGLLSRAEADGLPLLLAKYIDPYADTTFNSWQIPDLLTDLRALALNATSPEKAALEAISALGVACEYEAHLYLKFVGD